MDATLIDKAVFDETILYPNPTNDIIYVKGLMENDWSYTIYGVEGKIYTTNKITDGMIKVEDLKPGVYVIQFSNGKYIITKKIIKKGF
ncbi:MAG: T9SS type A sorting domain-containing protein [Saprospiraceae bacterium]